MESNTGGWVFIIRDGYLDRDSITWLPTRKAIGRHFKDIMERHP